MLADWSRLLRWTLLLVIGFFALARPAEVRKAWADGDDDDDSASSGGGDDGGGGDDDDSSGDDDATQPPVTAGGLYTKATYPLSELQRPLTITGGMTELRGGVNIDASNASAFSHYGVEVNGRYGVSDNVEGLFLVHSDLNDFGWQNGFTLSAALEGSISYDLVDFRIGAQVATKEKPHRFGIPIGFPFRYAPKPQVGIVAMEQLITFRLGKPDFTPVVAIVVQPIPALALKLKAAADVVGFDFSKTASVVIPVSVNIQYSPSNLLDFGGEFQFPNLHPAPVADPMNPGQTITPKFYDTRALLLYVQLRV